MENQVFDDPAVLQMFADNTLQIGLGDVVVPGAIRLHAKDGATLAGRDTAGARPLDAQRAGLQPEPGILDLSAKLSTSAWPSQLSEQHGPVLASSWRC